MHHRPLTIAGCVTGTLALVLLAWLVYHGIRFDQPMTTRIAVLATADVMLGMASLGLLGHGAAWARGHVDGVRETVDRLAAALPKSPTA
ncbi:hypothetical protein [Micromonospora sp. NPDC003816]|uniref:hypothetical protein n=1 Tax=Micromonospora sp. NPDC003816 TaxID=3364224 RepID=UPI0036781AE4